MGANSVREEVSPDEGVPASAVEKMIKTVRTSANPMAILLFGVIGPPGLRARSNISPRGAYTPDPAAINKHLNQHIDVLAGLVDRLPQRPKLQTYFFENLSGPIRKYGGIQ
jgi:hypothetical protein